MLQFSCMVWGEDSEIVLELRQDDDGTDVYDQVLAKLREQATQSHRLFKDDMKVFLTKSAIDGTWLTDSTDSRDRIQNRLVNLDVYTEVDQTNLLDEMLGDDFVWKSTVIYFLVKVQQPLVMTGGTGGETRFNCLVCDDEVEFVVTLALLPSTLGVDLYGAVVRALISQKRKFDEIVLYLARSKENGEWLLKTPETLDRVSVGRVELGEYTKIYLSDLVEDVIGSGVEWNSSVVQLLIKVITW